MTISNGQLWMYTLALLIIWVVVLTTAFSDVSHIKNKVALSQTNAEGEAKNTGICKNVCMHCGCLGFFCGEECICECNNDHANTDCVGKIQKSAQSLSIPYEILIQGPTDNNLVRKALFSEQNKERKLYGYGSKRSSVTVYKPSNENLNMHKTSSEMKTALKNVAKLRENFKSRHKRSSANSNFEWFNNLGSNLLRPAPLSGHKKQIEEPKKPTIETTTASSIFNNSWIFDSTRNVLTPRPLNIWKNSKLSPPTDDKSMADTSLDVKNFQTNEQFGDDFTEDGKIDYQFSEELINSKPNKRNMNSPEVNNFEESQENLIGSLCKHLFKNNFNKIEEKLSLLPDEQGQEESLDYLAGVRQPVSYKDDLIQIANDKADLFSEEIEEENDPNKKVQFGKTDDPSTLENLSGLNIKKGLQQLRIPWLKPGRLLEKFRQVIHH